MEPRPILLVETEDEQGKIRVLSDAIGGVLSREGYIVLHCPPSSARKFRVLAPCPFTEADVEVLRDGAAGQWAASPDSYPRAELESIADRMRGML